jgi:hypothetical protein
MEGVMASVFKPKGSKRYVIIRSCEVDAEVAERNATKPTAVK